MEIEDLYNLIPNVLCPPGCISCCRKFGIPSRIPEEDEKIKAYLKRQNISGRVNDFPVSDGDYTCPYVTTRGCAIYPVRPFICRLYGASPNYLCMEQVKPLFLLSLEEEEELFYLYYQLSLKGS